MVLRDVYKRQTGVHIRLLVDGMESWIDMEGNPYFYGLSSHENVEIKLYNKANPLKPWKMMGRMHDKYLIADGKRYIPVSYTHLDVYKRQTYSIGHHRFIEMARAAGAVYKIGEAKGNTILINLEVFDERCV